MKKCEWCREKECKNKTNYCSPNCRSARTASMRRLARDAYWLRKIEEWPWEKVRAELKTTVSLEVLRALVTRFDEDMWEPVTNYRAEWVALKK